MSNTKLYLNNLTQKFLFEHELSGQISDGMWENARPYDHWQKPCKLEVELSNDKLGVTTSLMKNNYNFSSKELLDCISDRMIMIGKIVTSNQFTTDEIKILLSNYVNECDDNKAFQMMLTKCNSHYTKRLGITKSINDIYNKMIIVYDTKYDLKDLKKDLEVIKKAFKTRIFED